MRKVKEGKRYCNIMDLENVSGILRYLSEHDEAAAIDLRMVIPTYERMKRTMEAMRDSGLVDIQYVETPRIKFTYRLTEKGRRAASKLQELDEIINS